MKVVYLILCHINTEILRESIRILSNDNKVVMHVDKKSNIKDFEVYKDNKNVTFISERVDVKWGHFSMIQAMIELIKRANDISGDYYVFLSGDCLPVKSSCEIMDYFESMKGIEFIGVGNYPEEANRRMKYQYTDRYYIKHKGLLTKINDYLDVKLKLLSINPYYQHLPQLYKGSQWISISNEFRLYVLSYIKDNPMFLEAFKYSVCGDELFFQTIACNSPFADKIHRREEDVLDAIKAQRYIDWTLPEYKLRLINNVKPLRRFADWVSRVDLPKKLTESDFPKIKESGCLFARKFSPEIDLMEYRSFFGIE